MKEYLKHQKINRKKKTSKLVIAAIAGGLISVAGIVAYLTNPEYETIFEKRVRYLEIANEQLMHAQNPEEIIGLNRVITNIENGVYDY